MLGSAHGVVVDFAELSDPGRDPSKQVNEDASGYAETPIGHLAVVCDGMGGHEAGREASQAAVRCIIETARGQSPSVIPGLVLKHAIERAGRAVYALGGAAQAAHRPGSTCVAVLIHPGGAEVAHAGDSRAYLVRGEQIERLTRDHSMVQELVEARMLTPEQALAHPDANQITRALGIAPEVAVDVRPEPLGLAPGDVLLLASDGLTDLVSDPEISEVVRRRVQNGTAAVCQELVALANARGGHDNVTALVLSIVEMPASTTARGTVIERVSGTLIAEPKSTLLDPESAPAKTLFDDGVTRPTLPGSTQVDGGDRRTEPGLSARLPSFAHDEHPHVEARPGSSSRLLLWLAIVLVGSALAAVAAWALRKSVHRGRDQQEELVPPPQVKAPPKPETVAAPDDAETPTLTPRDDGDAGS